MDSQLDLTLHYRGYGFDPGWGAKISHASWPKAKTENRNGIALSVIYGR